MSQATAFEGFIDRSPSCPVSYVFAATESEGHKRFVLAARVKEFEKLTNSQSVQEAWVAIAASIPPSKETSPVGTPPEREFKAIPQPQQVATALKILDREDGLTAECVAHQAYWDFLATHPGINPAGDF